MAGTVADLKRLLESRVVLNEQLFAGLDCDAVLDERDRDPFDAEWVRANKGLKEARRDCQIEEEDRQLIDEIRHLVFRQTVEFVGNHEICSYVSDDFEMIASALAVGHDDGWINVLWLSYKSGAVPSGDLRPSQGKLASFV